MRNLLLLAFLSLLCNTLSAQYYGMDSVSLGSSNIKAVIYPAAAKRIPGKKYPLMIHYEGSDQVGSVLASVFGAGFPRQVMNNRVQGTVADSIIHVCPLATSSGSLKYPAMFNQVMDYCLANLPVDTAKNDRGMYKLVCVDGIGQGASDAWDNLAWYTTGNGDLKYIGKIGHAAFMSTPNLYPASDAFANYQYTNTKFLHEQNTNSCCQYGPAQSMSSTLAKTTGAISTFTLYTMSNNGFNNFTWDSMYSPFGGDTVTNIYRWLLNSASPPAPTPAPYYGMDSVTFGTSNIKAVIYPAAAKRIPGKLYPLMIHYEGTDQVGSILASVFGAGFPRQVMNNKIQGTVADSIIHICPLSTSVGSLKYPSMFNQVMDYCLANLPVDSSKDGHGMYKLISVDGIGQGASDAWDNLAWYTTNNGELKYIGKISHATFMSTPNLYPAPEAFANYQYTNTKFLHEQNTNSCCQYGPAQSMSSTLAKTTGAISSFTLYTMANNGFNNFTWDSMYSPFGADTVTNIYRWLLNSAKVITPPTFTPVKLKVYESSLYDLSGRINHKDRPFNFFDAFETIDPKNGNIDFEAQTVLDELGKPKLVRGDTTNAIPGSGRDGAYFYGASDRTLAFGGYYFPGKRGRCIIVDLANDPSIKHALITHGKKFNITDVYGWERNFEQGDSLFFYNFDKVIEETDVRKIPYMISRPDSLLKPFAVLVTQGGTSSTGMWRNVSDITDSMRYIMIRNTLQQRSGYTSTAYFNEVVFYGSPRGDSTQKPVGYSGPLPVQKTLFDKSGVNTGVQIDTNVMSIVKNIRQYVNVDWYDTDTDPATKYKQLFNADYFPGYLNWNLYWTPHNHNHWLAVFGASKRAGDEMKQSVRNNIDTPYAEPGDWLHYVSHGRLFYQLAYKWGNNKSLDGTKYRWFNDATLSGYAQNWHPFLELGNEDDTYEPPAVSAAKLIMAVNGNNRYLGDTLGIRNADPGTKIVYAGQTYPDTFRIRTVMLLAYTMMKDTTTKLFDVFSYHDYSRLIDTVSGIVGPTYEEQVGNGGMIPERNNWYNESSDIAKFIWKITGDTSIKTWNTEYGFDNFSVRPGTTDQLGVNWTTTAVPRITGYDSVESKSIVMMRMELIMGASQLDGFTEFNAHNSNLDATNNVSTNFYTTGWGGGNYGLSTKFTNYYAKKWMYGRMGDYAVDSVISSDGTGLWLIKWRKQTDRDSVMFSIWKGSENATKLDYEDVKIEGVTSGTTKEVYNFSTKTADVTAIKKNDSYTFSVTEMPAFIFCREAAGNKARIRFKDKKDHKGD
ncbi:hypothetical protein [Pinibacter aurantiacus]|uniref:Uncharacterized protein n=1 Tax=Pinibacter aurantiacus TaxID=2851599 RepID=A0A9E2SCV3_9BACT|nr:hypothetical protein [Pinibacter aurantiacus]MBV4358948.1 hypothetical protein [Pinibacter aurantiacus]